MSEAPEFAVETEPLKEMPCPHCDAIADVADAASFSKIKCPSCGRKMTVGARFGQFLLLDLLGSGGMGSVFKARDETLGRLVAIKVMLRTLGDDPIFSETFKREAQAAAKLNHPHIAQIYSFGQQSGQPYIVMELIPGKSLDDLIEEGRQLTDTFVMAVGSDIADGLRMAAAVDLVHGDIKPENILMDEQGQAKLVDFGIASVSEKNEEEIWGTPYYISPEKIRRQKIDLRTDIYSLGATLYHSLAGKPPFEGENAIEVIKARFHGPPPLLSEIRTDLDPQIDQIISRMLQIEPSMRYPTYESLLGDMRRFLEKAGAPKKTSALAAPYSGSRSGSRRVVVRKKGKSNIRLSAQGSSSSSSGNLGTPSSEPSRNDSGESDSGGEERAAEAKVPSATSAASSGKKRKKTSAIVILFLLLVLLLAAGAYFFVWQPRQESGEQQTAAQTRREKYEQWHREWAALNDRAETLAEQAGLAATVSSNRLGQVSNAFAKAFGDGVVWEEKREERIEEVTRVQMIGAMQVVTSAVPRIQAQASATIRSAAAVGETGAHFEEAARKAETVIPEQWIAAAQQAHEEAERKIEETVAASRQLDEAEQKAAEGLAKLDKEIELLEQERERAREQARLEAERAREEAEQARLRAQQQAAIERDIEKVHEVESAQREKIQQHRFREVLWPLRNLKTELQTEEGRRELENAQERIERIIALMEFLKEQLAEHGFRRGWIENNIPYDIEGATDRAIVLPSREIPWAKVDVATTVRIIHHFLVQGPTAEDQSLRVRSNQLLNAALYSLLVGQGNPSAEQLAQKLVEQARRQLPLIEDNVQRLIPQFRRQENDF